MKIPKNCRNHVRVSFIIKNVCINIFLSECIILNLNFMHSIFAYKSGYNYIINFSNIKN